MTPFKEKDYLNGDHSFKMWFKIMWKNFYIQLFAIDLFFLSLLFALYKDRDLGFYIACFILIGGMAVIAFKGFYQFWEDLKGGKSR